MERYGISAQTNAPTFIRTDKNRGRYSPPRLIVGKTKFFDRLFDFFDRDALQQLARAAAGALRAVVHARHRVIRVLLTDKGEQANALHSQFHARMIDSATQGLTEQELDALIQSLKNLSAFFQDMTTQAQNA